MATVVAPPAASVLHPQALRFTAPPHPDERRIGLLFAGTGLGLVLLMGIAGIAMRLTQATVLTLSPAWFYRLLTLHGVGMITGVLLGSMGAAWYVVNSVVPLRPRAMLTAHALIGLAAVCVLAATLVGGFGAGWTFLAPLPFHPAGQWPVWSESVFFVGMLLAGAGFFVFCLDVLEQVTARHGGFTGALGWRYLTGRAPVPPPPQVIAVTVVVIDGLLACAVGTAVLTALLGHTYDSAVGLDALVAKNYIYFFGHSVANLSMYLGAAVVYVIMPRYAGRPYAVSKPFVLGWAGSLVFIVTAYSHHLYMDFVQPQWAEIISEATSYTALVPVAVVTIYSMTMLVWGSRFRWTLGSSLFYLGLTGWTIGGIGAVIDSLIPFNFRFHNTDWVVAHFHTYLIIGILLWVFGFLTHVLEHDSGRTTSKRMVMSTIAPIVVGGYGLTGTWFVEGALGVPRRYAVQPPGTAGYSLAGSIFALILAAGFLLLCVQIAQLGREAWWRRHGRERPFAPAPAAASRPDPLSRVSTGDGDGDGDVDGEPAKTGTDSDRAPLPARGVPFATPAQMGLGACLVVIGLVSFLPTVIHASEVSVQYHHLDHAGQFFLGIMLGLLAGSHPRVSRWLGSRHVSGTAAVIVAPTVMMLIMVPGVYESLERHSVTHALYHLVMAVFGLVTGLGATRLGRDTGRLAAALAIGMAVMFVAVAS